MQLQYLTIEACPICGNKNVISENVKTSCVPPYEILEHTSGGRWETRKFQCGMQVEYWPNFKSSYTSKGAVCRNDLKRNIRNARRALAKENVLDEVVKKCLEQHQGGEVFFDHLDKAVQQKPIIDQLMSLLKEEKNIIVSGKFGLFLYSYLGISIFNDYDNFLVVNGGLRKDKQVAFLDISYKSNDDFNGVEFALIDDSYYSGKTRNAIAKELEKIGACLTKVYVVYDGSKEKDETVTSLYRYYR